MIAWPLIVAVMRPDAWDLPLFVHVLGAMLLLGITAVWVRVALGRPQGPESAWQSRLSLRIALLATLPAFAVMRVGAELIRMKEFNAGGEPSWIGIGYGAADGGALFLLIAIILTWLAVRRGSTRLLRTGAVLMAVAGVAWIVTAWAMTAKPA